MKSLLKFLIIAIFTLSLNLCVYHFSSVTANPHLNLIQSAKQYYDQGQYSQSVEYLQKAVDTYETNKDIINQIQALSWLSLAQQKLGNWTEAEKAINTSISLLTNVPNINSIIKAQVYNAQGHLQLAKGEDEAALINWQKAENLYNQAGDKSGIIGSKINQVQALVKLGLYNQAEEILNQVEITANTITDQELKSTTLQNLGEFYTKKGNLTKAEEILKKSLAIAKKLNNLDLQSRIFLSLGNNEYSVAQNSINYVPDVSDVEGNQNKKIEDVRQDYRNKKLHQARDYYKYAENTHIKLTKIKAQSNEISILINLGEENKKNDLLELLSNIKKSLGHVNTGRESIFTQINLVNNLIKIDSNKLGISDKKLEEILINAVQQARILKDARAESEALGTLTKLYQKTGKIDHALKINKQALIIAQSINAEDLTFRWWSLLGQINQQKGNQKEALKAYNTSIQILKTLRSDLVGLNQDLQFSFREGVEPIYRQYVNLLLTDNPGQENLQKARETIEGLQLAELDNFFKEACLIARPKQIDEIDKNAAVIYPIILLNRLAVIAYLPGQPLKYYQTNLVEKEIETKINNFFDELRSTNLIKIKNSSKLIYDWLLKPVENDLKNSKIETLVFVLDGELRRLPMSVLFDGEKYLIEKYSIALSPGLQLLPPKSLTLKESKLLIGAITQNRPGFSALPFVKDEVKNISEKFTNQSFVDEQFTKEHFQELINKIPFPVVHFATHGKFSSNPEQTFILTWDDKININELEQLIKGREKAKIIPIELLVLSACQTANGDHRASLGLAGLAVKSGARSTVASLWNINDNSTTQLMSEFYQQLSKGVNKAEALRQAQIKLLHGTEYNYKSPYYWGAFVLVGNWL